jgi:hypothetical protein
MRQNKFPSRDFRSAAPVHSTRMVNGGFPEIGRLWFQISGCAQVAIYFMEGAALTKGRRRPTRSILPQILAVLSTTQSLAIYRWTPMVR